MVNNKLKVLEKFMIINRTAKYDRHTTHHGRIFFGGRRQIKATKFNVHVIRSKLSCLFFAP